MPRPLHGAPRSATTPPPSPFPNQLFVTLTPEEQREAIKRLAGHARRVHHLALAGAL